MPDSPLATLDALHLRAALAALAADEVSPSELLERCLSRVQLAEPFGAFVCLDEVGARRAVAQLDPRRRGPLYGVPVAVKDLIDVAGLPTRAGRRSGAIACEDAPVVAMLRRAGAVVVGKTRCDELGLATFTPGARDPRDPLRSPGGSSGGSAIAVAVGAAALALATDTAGSARIPAAACGVAGLCASAAGLPGGGVVQLSPTFDRLGVIAADGLDLEIAWDALTGSPPGKLPARVFTLTAGALGTVDPDHAAAAAAAALRLGEVEEISEQTLGALGAFGAARAVVIASDAADRHASSDAEFEVVRRQLVAGAGHSREDVAAARRRLAVLGDRLRAAIEDAVLVTPTLPSLPPYWSKITEVDQQLRAIGRLTRLCAPVNSSGLVSASVPCWLDHAERPFGVQLIALSEGVVLAAAAHLARIDVRTAAPTKYSRPHPD